MFAVKIEVNLRSQIQPYQNFGETNENDSFSQNLQCIWATQENMQIGKWIEVLEIL